MFRKVLLTIGLLLAANVAVLAQGTLRGVVTDSKTGEAQPFVNVVVMQDGRQVKGAATDFDGQYVIKPLPVGKYDIVVSATGYHKVTRESVQVSASGIAVENFQLVSSTVVLEAVEIREERVPVIEIGTPESGQRISSDDISRMPGSSIASVTASIAGVGYSDGGTGTARGEGGMVTMQNGVRKRNGVDPPKDAIAEIQVILGGTPASIGEAIGGTQIITLKPPQPQLSGNFRLDNRLDYTRLTRFSYYLTGPVLKKKVEENGSSYDKTVVGFRLSGLATYIYDGYYRSKDGLYQVVNDDVIDYLRQNPISYNPLEGTYMYTGEGGIVDKETGEVRGLMAKDFHTVKSKPGNQSISFSTEGALLFRFSDYTTLTLTGEFYYGKGHGSGDFPLNMSLGNASVSESLEYGITADFTQQFHGTQSNTSESTMPESKAAISNVMYNLIGSISRSTSKSYNENFGDNMFKYGHVGQFYTNKIATFETQSFDYDGITYATAQVQNAWLDDMYAFDPSNSSNPLLANYTSWLMNNENLSSYMTSFDAIRQFNGLLNGDRPGSIYGLLSNVGVQTGSYGMSTTDTRYFQAKAKADIKGHEVEIGFQYDQYSQSSYSVSSYNLWTLMRNYANSHISQLDLSNPHATLNGSQLTVTYDRLNAGGQSSFDASLRQLLGWDVNGTDWLDIDRYLPDEYANYETAMGINDYKGLPGMSMFSSSELFNSGNYAVSYYGYDHTGAKYNGKGWNLDEFFNPVNHPNYQYLPAFSPIYMAGYIQDKFYFQDLIFNVGVRLDYFDGNQPVLKDPYLLYESYTVGDLRREGVEYAGTLYEGAGDDWVVYVNNAADVVPTIKGYRSGSTWYDVNGVELSSPTPVNGDSGKPTPFRTKGENGGQATATIGNASGNKVSAAAFEDYKPQIVVMPRIAFSFPVGDNSQFKASYDIIARRPSSNWQANYVGYLFMNQISSISNPNLKPERITNYELGFQQALNKTSAISITAYYKETRDLIQIVQYAGADPNNSYFSYGNLDFKTIKGFSLSYDLRQTKNLRINANYTLQYAEGTGLTPTTMTELIKEGYTTLKMLNPISDDRRHEFKANVDYRYMGGNKYNGPVISLTKKNKETGEKEKVDWKPLQNAGINFMAVAQSGRPYTAALSNKQNTIVGSYQGARLPWSFFFDVVVDKSWPISVGKEGKAKHQTLLTAYLTITNLFDIRNVAGVYSVTGNPTDNGYLTDPECQSEIDQNYDSQSFRELYAIALSNGSWNFSRPRNIQVTLSYSF